MRYNRFINEGGLSMDYISIFYKLMDGKSLYGNNLVVTEKEITDILRENNIDKKSLTSKCFKYPSIDFYDSMIDGVNDVLAKYNIAQRFTLGDDNIIPKINITPDVKISYVSSIHFEREVFRLGKSKYRKSIDLSKFKSLIHDINNELCKYKLAYLAVTA